MKKLLAIETSSHACSAALYCDGEFITDYQFLPNQHNQILLPMIDHLLSATHLSLKNLDAIAFGCGPGSFTGIRIAAATTQGLTLCHSLPVIPISSLQTLAQTAFVTHGIDSVLICVDARMEAVYWGQYQYDQHEKKMVLLNAEQCSSPEEVIDAMQNIKCYGVGDGWKSYPLLQQKITKVQDVIVDIYPNAREVAYLALQAKKRYAPEGALPNYLRNLQYKKLK